MKKAVSIMLFFALFLLLAGCKEVPVSESSEPLNSNNVIKWFDCLNGDEMAWDGVKEYDLDEFSVVTFRWHPERLEAVADGTTIPLYDGMPIWSVYFYDLTGDVEKRAYMQDELIESGELVFLNDTIQIKTE